MKIPVIIALLAALAPDLAQAHEVRFTENWKVLDFWRIPATEYRMQGRAVEITANQSSSVVYTPLHRADWLASIASWTWETTASVPPTNLAKKGADDRNIALYFVFLDRKTAERIGERAGIKKLLTSRQSRIIVYTFGGDKPDGSFEPNPYLGDRGSIVILRGARAGAYSESVDLSRDFARAFGRPRNGDVLVGVALASDSDDTGKVVEARVSDLILR